MPYTCAQDKCVNYKYCYILFTLCTPVSHIMASYELTPTLFRASYLSLKRCLFVCCCFFFFGGGGGGGRDGYHA